MKHLYNTGTTFYTFVHDSSLTHLVYNPRTHSSTQSWAELIHPATDFHSIACWLQTNGCNQDLHDSIAPAKRSRLPDSIVSANSSGSVHQYWLWQWLIKGRWCNGIFWEKGVPFVHSSILTYDNFGIQEAQWVCWQNHCYCQRIHSTLIVLSLCWEHSLCWHLSKWINCSRCSPNEKWSKQNCGKNKETTRSHVLKGGTTPTQHISPCHDNLDGPMSWWPILNIRMIKCCRPWWP